MLIPNLITSALRTADAEPANGVVVSVHTNERGSTVCNRTRGVPDGRSHGNLRLPRDPSLPAEDRNDGRCANGNLPSAHTTPNTNVYKGCVPLGIPNETAPIEPFGRDVMRPLPMVERPPHS